MAGIRMHPRVQVVNRAERELRDAVSNWSRGEAATELTLLEYLQVVNRVLHDDVAGTLKYEIREERHGDTDRPGDWAPEPEATCNRCGAPKGLQAVGESCNNNCGGKVVANEALA
jgi:hypothetical protein